MEYFPVYLYVALLLLASVLSTRLMRLLKLPNVTGYLITGILFGPFVFGILFNNFSFEGIKDGPIFQYVQQIGWVSNVALGFIAFSIGTSFKMSVLKSVGKRVLIITVLEATMASLAVIIALMVAHFIFPEQIGWEIVLILGAIASATAPAATLMVIKQYRARGSLVDTLLPVVALDDAVALILYAILFQLAVNLSSGGGFDPYLMIAKPILEIFISLGLGAVVGIFITFLNRFFHSRNNKLVLCILTVFAAIGLSLLFKTPAMGGFELSSLLFCMIAGAIYSNFAKESGPTLDVLERFTSPIYSMFFVLSGASLDLSIFFRDNGYIVVAIAGVYLFFRVIGKWSGAFVGSTITRSEPKIRKYLGFALIPQAGVAIGLATSASRSLGAIPGLEASGALLLAVILSSTLVYELIGPLTAKFALQKAGEITLEN